MSQHRNDLDDEVTNKKQLTNKEMVRLLNSLKHFEVARLRLLEQDRNLRNNLFKTLGKPLGKDYTHRVSLMDYLSIEIDHQQNDNLKL